MRPADDIELIPQSFYARPAQIVGRALLGQQLVRLLPDGRKVGGIIVETEAYCDSVEPDLACHGTRNGGRPTSRTAVMFGPAGFAYVYFTYGMHWMFNVVTGLESQANAVLIRALEPTVGEATMKELRSGRERRQWTNGPAKLTQALAIDRELQGANLCLPGGVVWIEAACPPGEEAIMSGPRVGLGQTPEPWFSIPWRYWLADNPFVSAYR